MGLEEIQLLWDEDAKIDRLDLGNESINIPKLHAKYYRIYVREAMSLKKQEADLKILKLDKYEFYTQGPTQETHDKGWRLPPQGKILKSEVQNYIEADRDIITATLKMALQKEKVDFVHSIIQSFNQRSFNISNAIKFEIFRQGG